MRILYTLNSGNIGGAELHVRQLVKGMVAKGHRVFVMCPEGELVTDYISAGATHINSKPAFELDLFYIFSLYKFLRRENIEILHAHQLVTVSLGLVAGWFAKTPVKIAHVHSPISGWKVPIYKKIPDLVVNYLTVNLLSDVAIALTNEIRKERVKSEWIWERKIRVIPNGIEISKFKVQSSKSKAKEKWIDKLGLASNINLVGTLSRLTEEKGIDVLMEAISVIKKQHQDVYDRTHFLIAGEGHLRSELEDQVGEFGLQDHITFLGFINDEDHQEFYRALDLFVFPTLHEGFGYVLAEAMVSGTPTLSSDLPVLEELTNDGEHGFHFKRGNPKDLSDKLVGLLEDPELRLRCIDKAIEKIENDFSSERFVGRYEKLYKELLSADR